VLPPSVPVYRPTFMPERFGPPELVAAGAYNYTIVYRAPYEVAGKSPFELVAFYSGTPEGALANSPGDPSQKIEGVSIAGEQGTMVTITEADPAVLDPKFLGAFWQRDGKPYGIKAYSNLMTVEEFRQIIDGMEEVQ
jgi:hypothetical protein